VECIDLPTAAVDVSALAEIIVQGWAIGAALVLTAVPAKALLRFIQQLFKKA